MYSLGQYYITATTIGKNERDNFMEMINKFKTIFLFGGHRIIWGWIRILEERGTGKDCLQLVMII